MTLHEPPYYRYPLLRPWDKDLFAFIQKAAKNKTYPRVTGSADDKSKYLVVLICSQKLPDWRDVLKETYNQMKSGGVIDAAVIVQKYYGGLMSREVPRWVTYPEDRIVSDFIDDLTTRSIRFVGSDDEIGEFALRFILGQLGNDWELTIMMIWEMLGDGTSLSVSELNGEMKHFDYAHVFGD